jgi:predicted solute-binding protein
LTAAGNGAAAGRGRRLRLAAVSYVNAWPLVDGLAARPDVDVVTGVPSAVAALVEAGEVDAGLVPSIELLRQGGLVPVGNLGIAAFGPVASVLLLLRTAPRSVRTLAMDPASRTSQALARIVLDRAFGARPETFEADPGEAWRAGRADAVLVIGDRALDLGSAGAPAIDLGDAWARLTGLPFVFAVWGAKSERRDLHAAIASVLDAAWQAGRAAIPTLARRAARDGALSAAAFEVYLTRRIRYGLGRPELSGLSRFLEMARALSGGDSARCST